MSLSASASASASVSASASGGVSASMGTPASVQRGKLVSESLKITVDLDFNPDSLTFGKAWEWQPVADPAGKESKSQWVGSENGKLDLKLLFDAHGPATSKDKKGVMGPILRLHEMANSPLEEEGKPKAPRAVTFEWGTIRYVGVIANISVNYVLFSSEGYPLRADVAVSMLEETDPERVLGLQNPTSQGHSLLKLHRVLSGETLQSIAQLHYRDCGRWRVIAEANGLNRVRRLTPGAELRIPDV